MVTGIVGPASVLLDDDPFRIPRAAAYFWVHIILAIAAQGKVPFAILEHPAADISRQGLALTLLNCLQQVFGFLQGVLRDAMQLSIERRRDIAKSWPCGLNGWDRGRRYSRFKRRTGAGSTRGTAEQYPTKDDEYSINLPSSIHSFAFVSRSEEAQ